ncbi:MAG TPA: ABC transporter permease [Candidatus Limnocylindrales bacterium]|nr:ABC transporter permease [Candidatus Limnocylindrales bacterium]
MQTFLQDLRFGCRMLLKHPAFTALGILILTLGIAGNIVIFSFFNSFFLRPFPFKEADRLVDLDEAAPRWNLERTGLSYPSFYQWRQANHAFDGMGAWAGVSFNMSLGEQPQRISGAKVTHDVGAVFGIQPVLGRLFLPDEDRPLGPKVVVLGHTLWKKAFASANVVGQVVRLDKEPYTIVGVLPPDVAVFDDCDFWVPLREGPDSQSGWYLRGVARLKPGVTLAQARADLARVRAGLLEQKRTNENTFPRVDWLSERFFGEGRLVLHVLLAAGGLVLLIACGNIAALTLARGLVRSREFGVRLSLGASPWRLAQLIGLEALLLAAAGGLFGIGAGYWSLKRLLTSIPERIPTWVHFDLDWRVTLFAGVLVLAASCLGAGPAIRSALSSNLQLALQSGTQQTTVSGSKRRSLNALVVAELALTMVLMVQATLLLQAFRALQQGDPGYRADNVLLYEIALPDAGYGSNEKKLAFFREHLEKVRSLPGVTAASIVSAPPLGGHWGNFFTVENAAHKAPNAPDPVILQRIAFPGYFETMEIKLLAGRGFTEQDGLNAGSLAVVVNEIFAREAWPNQDAVGKRLRHRGDNTPWLNVVGVVRDVKHYGLDRPMIPGVYLPYQEMPLAGMTVVVRGAVSPSGLVPSIRALLRQADPELPMINVVTMAERLSQSMWVRRLYSLLIAIFAGVALAMAIGGIAGVFSFVVSRRIHEMGIRVALGARRQDVLWLVLRQGLGLASLGIGLGLACALATTPLLRNLLFGVSPLEPGTFVGIAMLLTAVALVACWVPARRAMSVEPMTALRHE